MTTFGFLGKYKIKLYSRDHNPPHVHIEHADITVRIDIINIAVMSITGKPSKKELHVMLIYVDNFKNHLLEAWNELQEK